MAIKIERIKIKRGGPLEKDFELAPGDLNLVYGHNETGKTYIVETMINLLFKTGTRSPAKWNLREWDLAGTIVLSGLKDEPVRFTKTGKKLEDYWKEGPGLPTDLSRLLVVKAGQTVLVAQEGDGVGRDLLKDYLSGEGLLDGIASGISPTLKEATLENGQIAGARRGEISNRIRCEEDLGRVNKLLHDVEEHYTAGVVYSLQRKKERTEAELDHLKKAKRYHAAQLDEQIQGLRRKRETLPSEEELSKLESDIRIHEENEAQLKGKSARLTELEGSSEDYRWAGKALGHYREIASGKVAPGGIPILAMLGLLLLVGAVMAGLVGLRVPLVISGAGSVVLFVLYYLRTKRALSRPAEHRELENLKEEFEKRFTHKLTDIATLEAQVEKLKENHIRATQLKEEVEELTLETEKQHSVIVSALKDFAATEPPPQEWRETLKKVRSENKDCDSEISSLDRTLSPLGVTTDDYVDEEPETGWDADRYAELERELEETEKVLEAETKKLGELKTRIAQETGSKSTEWEDLMSELTDKYEMSVAEYREATAEILAKIQLNTVIQEFREQENTRIAEGLSKPELTEPLRALTGRYDRIKRDDDSGLLVMTDDDEEYPLGDISTGAQEQIYLALRMGFASMAIEGQTAFLILDDAFQHSDWKRRDNLITQTVSLVKNGWQVFYFAMDDHLRDLFNQKGKVLGKQYRFIEIQT